MRKTFIVAATVAAWSVAGTAFARPPVQDKPKETTVVVKDDAGEKSKQAADKTEKAAQKTGKAVTDTSITTEVKTRLMKDKAGRANKIDVDTKSGVVTIAGSVPTATDKARIGRLVEKTTGVKSVQNNLTVGVAAGTSGHDGVAVKDDSGAVAIKTDDSKVVVKDDAAEKGRSAADKSEDAAKKTGDAISDASITTAVKTRLMSDTAARGRSIDVSTKNGVVTIGGAVPTGADRARIGELVEKTTGVKSVNNALTVK
ncbi:MAG TPA: BON domain-containing protein [Vicinamibacterales bacterium]|jgi:osmotically-inducible protein OsmY